MAKLLETQVADYVATTNSGSVQVIHQLDRNQKEKVKDTQTIADLEEVPGSSKALNEVEIQNQDSIAVAKQVGKALASALRSHGDQIETISAKQCNTKGCVIVVQYGKPGDEVGANSNNPQVQNNNIEQDEFQFSYQNGILCLESGDLNIEICPIRNQSGTVKIQQPVAQDRLLKFIENKTPSELGDSADQEQPQEISEEARKIFAEAVKDYRASKSKDSIKSLFKAARNFRGNTIQEKLKEAAQDFLNRTAVVEPESIERVVATAKPLDPTQPCSGEGCEDTESPISDNPDTSVDICMNVSVLLRLLEYAKDEVKDDSQLHFIAQNIESRKTVTMDDFEDIIKIPDSGEENEENMDEYFDEDGNYVPDDEDLYDRGESFERG